MERCRGKGAWHACRGGTYEVFRSPLVVYVVIGLDPMPRNVRVMYDQSGTQATYM